jgi:hypothetical protein
VQPNPKRGFRHVYAVVRIDLPVNTECPENSFSVVKVFTSKDAAERDAARLNSVNAGRRCEYHTYVSRMALIH